MKKLSFTFIAAAALLLAACNDKENVVDNKGNGEPVMTTFKITTPKTYADGSDEVGSDDENKIEIVEFYMCGSDGTRDESLYAYHKYTGAANEEISFLVKPGNGKKILVAVNTDLGEQPGVNHGELEQLIEAAKLDNTNSQSIAAGKFVMSGKQVANIAENETANEVTVSLSRLASKVEPPVATNVTVSIPDKDLQKVFEDDMVTASGVQFAMTGYVLINGHNSSFVYTYYNDADNEKSA
ncbi:MAG: hypothetical protein LUD15_13585 [Bacteroides sp.]|nr:hypothetical protein [Bacteroides sp.]